MHHESILIVECSLYSFLVYLEYGLVMIKRGWSLLYTRTLPYQYLVTFVCPYYPRTLAYVILHRSKINKLNTYKNTYTFWYLTSAFLFQAPTEESLKDLHSKLESNSVDHKLWVEQPENIPTCIAVRPYLKSEVQSFFKGFKLFQ